MPNWKKLIVSGSDATLNSLHASAGAVVSGSLTASLFANGSDNQYFHIDNRFVSESHTDGNIGIQFSYGGNYQSRIISRKSQDFVGNLDFDGDLVIQQRFNSNNLDTAIFNQRGGLKLPIHNANNVGLNITRGENNAPLLWLSTDDNDAFDNFYAVNISGSIVATSFDLGDTFKIRATNSYNKATDDSSNNARDYFKIDDANEVTVFGHGNVGIGTTSPAVTLEIVSASSAAGTTFRISNGFGESPKKIEFVSTSNNASGNVIADIFGYGRRTTGNNGPYLAFRVWDQVNSSLDEVARFSTSGSLGIGVTNPTEKLQVAGSIHASGSGSEIITDEIFRAAGDVIRFRKSTNTWDAMRMAANGKLELAVGGNNDRGELVLYADYGSTPRAGVIQFQNESQGSSFLFTDTNKRLRFHTSDPGENDTVGAKVIYESFPDDFTIQGNIMLDDNSGDSPQISFRNESEVRYNINGTSGGNFQITRQDNGGADFTLVGDSTNFTGSYIQVGNSNQFGYNTVVANNITAGGNVKISTGNHLFFDGTGNSTYISEDIADRLRIFVGGAEFARFTESTTNTINFYPATTFAEDVNLSTGKSIYFSGTNGLRLLHDGTNGNVISGTGELKITNGAQDENIVFRGNDGGSSFTALTLDMSEAGKALFNSGGSFGGDISATAADFMLHHGNGPTIHLRRDDSTISNDNLLGAILFQGDDPSDGTFNSGVAIKGMAAGSWASGNYASKLILQTRNTSGNLANGLTIDEQQNANFAGDVVVAGTLTAQEFKTELVSASIVFESGSSQFGNSADDTHDFTGSVNINSPTTGVRIDLEDDTAKTRLLHNLHAFKIQVDPDNADANSNFRIEIDGDEYFRINGSGNVGIHATDPNGLLQLGTYTGNATDGAQSTFSGGLSIFTNSGTAGLFLGVKNASYANRGYSFKNTIVGVNSKLEIIEHGQSGTRLTINSGGKVQLNTYGSGTHTGTLAKSLGVDSSGNIIEFTGGSGGGTVSAITNGADNRIATFTGADSLNGEANLTFDGNIFAVNTNNLYVSASKVGIGTTSPDNSLELFKEQDGDYLGLKISKLHSNGYEYTTEYGNNQLKFSGNQNYNFYNDSNKVADFHNAHTKFYGNGGVLKMNISGSGEIVIGALSSGATGQLVVNAEGGVPPVAKFMSRTNKAIVQVSDNDTTGYLSSENGLLSLGRHAGVNAANININASHNVGIGTSSPAKKLDVVGSFRVQEGTSGTDEITTFNVSTHGTVSISRNHSTSPSISTSFSSGNSALSFVRSSATRTKIECDNSYFLGNLGIGVTSPAYKLDITGDSTSGVVAVRNSANGRDTLRSENAAGTRTLNIGNDGSGHGLLIIRNSSGTTTNYIPGSGHSYFTSGNVGIGTTAPAKNLHVVTTADQIAKFESSDASAKIEVADNTTAAYINANSGNASFGPFSSYSDNGNIRIFSGSVDHTSNGVGAFGATPSTNTKWKVAATVDTSADTSFNNTLIDLNVQGSTAITGDRTYRGLHVDIDSSATGGDTNDEVRLTGNYISINDTGDSDLISGVDVIAQTQMSDASSQTSNIRGVYASAKAANSAGLVSNLIGIQGNANMGSTAGGDIGGVYGMSATVTGGNTNKTPNSVYGGFFKIDPGANFASSFGTTRGVYSEIEIDGNTTTSNLRAFEGIIDLNTGSHDDLYQLKLDTQIAAEASQTGASYGIMSTGADRHFLQGKTLLGSNNQGTPGAELHIYGSGSGLVGISIQNASTSFDTNISDDGLSIGVNGNDAYFFSRESGDMYIAVNDTAANGITIKSGGNTGIGNTSPGYQLDVGGDINTSTGLIRRGGNAIIKSSGAETMIGPGGSGVITFHNSSTMASSDEKVRIDANGNLLLNNTSAGARLDIREDSNYAIRIEDASGHYFRVNTGGDTEIRGNVTVGGTITAQEFHTELVSASIVFESGSTIFGNSSDDTHAFTGSVNIKDGDILVTTTGGYFQVDTSDNSTKHADNTKAKFGTGNDFQIWHDGSNTYLSNEGVGDLNILNTADDKDINFKSDNGSGGTTTYLALDGSDTMMKAHRKLRFLDNVQLTLGNSDDVQFFHNGSDTFIDNYSGNFTIRQRLDDGDLSFESDDGSGGTAQYLRLDGGITSLVASKDLLFGADAIYAKWGASQDLIIGHDGSNSKIENYTGHLNIIQNANDKDIVFQNDDGSGGLVEYFKIDGGAGYNIANKDINVVDSIGITFGTGIDAFFKHSGAEFNFFNDTGNIVFNQRANDADILFKSDDGSGGLAEYLRIDGSAHTVNVGKNLVLNADDRKIRFGASTDFELYHASTSQSYIVNKTGHLTIQNEADDKDIIFRNDNGSGGTQTYLELDGSTKSLDIGDGINVNYDSISTSNSGTVVRGGFLNPASEANMVHLPHIINDLAGFNRWSNGTITTSGFYKTRGGSAGSYSYSNEVAANESGWANAFDAHSSTAGSWYSDNGTDGVFQSGSDTPGVVTLEWPNEAQYSLWAGIVFGSNSFTATYVKIEAYRGGAWQTLCEITDNTDQVVLRQVGSNSGGGAATTKLRYTLGGSVNGSYFRIHSLYMANYRAGDNNLNNTGIDSTRGVNFLERYKDGYLHGNLYPGADNTYDLGSSNYAWKNAYFESNIILNGTGRIQGIDTVSSATDAASKGYVDTQISNINSSNIDGSGTATYIAKFSDGNTIGSSGMFQAASNNFSIGVTTPNATLSISGDLSIGTSATDVLRLHNSSGVGTIDGYSTRNIAFGSVTNGEVMRIDNANGRVGIGTTSPAKSLHVESTNNEYVAKFAHSTATGYAPGSILLQAGQHASRGQGIYHYNTEADDSWFTGVPYAVDSQKWIVAHKPDTTFNTDVAQLSHAILTIDSATDSAIFGGNIGLGNATSPNRLLHIDNTPNATKASAYFYTNAQHTGVDTQAHVSIYSDHASSTGDVLHVRGDGTGNLLTLNKGGTDKLVVDDDGNATFGGNLRTPASGKLFLWTGHDSNFLQYNLWQASASGGMTIKNIASGGDIIFQTVSTTAITINSSQNTTLHGNVTTFGGLTVGDSNADTAQIGLKHLLGYCENTDVDTGTEDIKSLPLATYQAVFFDYVVKNGTNLRAGTVTAVHDGTNVEFTDTSTKDLGDTSGVTLSVDISGTNMRLRATTTSDNWIVKANIRGIKV